MYNTLVRQEHAHEDGVWGLAWSKHSHTGVETLVSGSVDSKVKAWSWDTNSDSLVAKWTADGHQLGVVSVAIDPSGEVAASSGLDGCIKLWELETGKLLKSIDGGPVDVWTLAFSADSCQLATGSHDGKINLFNVKEGKKQSALDTRGKFIMSIAYSRNGKLIASGAIDGIINFFDVKTERLLHTLEGHAMPVRSLCFSYDSRLLVTASDDRDMKIYDVEHAILAGTLSGHSSWVLSVAFSPDDKHFVTGSSDKTVKVWDSSTRQCCHTFKEHGDQVWSVCYNVNGTKIASVSDDKALELEMDIPDPKSGVLSGLLDYLTSKLEVRDVSLTEELPASVSQMLAWEETNGCSLPSDLKEFYRTNNGLTLTWKYLYNDVVHDIGRLNVNSIQELHLLGGQTQTDIFFSQEESLISARQPSLNDLDTPSSSDRWSPSLSGRCKTFILDYCPSCGHVCLVYNLENDADCRYWLLDLSLCWHPLSTTFSDYLRLAVVHLALVQWPYALTILGLSPQWERWFRMFIPKRLEIDLELSALQTNSTSIAHTTLDTSKIVIVKPSKEKKSKVEIRPTQGVQGHNN